jgi:CheY-specific phosphatase CheX
MVSSDQLQQIFLESASEVLETMCFVGVLGDTQSGEADPVSAELRFRGNPSGYFGVRMAPETAKLIAANFLGKETEEITDADMEQVLGELANMVCGSVLSRVEAGARFALSHPVILPAGHGSVYPEAVQSTLELEEGLMVIWMAVTGSVPVCSAA